jgi:hypothetical protein
MQEQNGPNAPSRQMGVRVPTDLVIARDRAAAMWRDLSLTSAQVAEQTGLHRSNLTKLFGPRTRGR